MSPCSARHQLGKFGDEDLFRGVADMRGVIDHQRLGVNAFEQVGRRDVGEIEGRILPHQDDVERGQIDSLAVTQRKVISRTVADLERAYGCKHRAVTQGQAIRRVIGQHMAAFLRLQQQRKR
jgi:hypothetical protein